MQDPLYTVRGLLPTIVERILQAHDKPGSKMQRTANANLRFQTIGMYHLILALADANQPATTGALARLGHVGTAYANELASKLVEFGWVERVQVTASHGRGRRFIFKPVADPDRLKALIGTLNPAPPKFGEGEGFNEETAPASPEDKLERIRAIVTARSVD